jgi:Abi-like protein
MVALAGPGSWTNDTNLEPASLAAKAKPPGGFGKRQPEGVISLGYRFMAALARRKKWANPQKAALKDLITSERLEPYRNATVTKTDEAALGLYLWNVDLSSALYADIASVEIFLRNAIDQQFRELFNKPQWYLDSSGAFIPEIGDRAISGLQTAQRWLGRNQPISAHRPGAVVAELTLGFWVGLLEANDKRNGILLDYASTLWLPTGQIGKGLRFGFPGLTQPSRRTLHRHVALLHETRNRIAHHEPIFEGVRRKGASVSDPHVRPEQVFEDLRSVAAALGDIALEWIDKTSRTKSVLIRSP